MENFDRGSMYEPPYHSIYDTEGFNKLIYSNFNIWILTKIFANFHVKDS